MPGALGKMLCLTASPLPRISITPSSPIRRMLSLAAGTTDEIHLQRELKSGMLSRFRVLQDARHYIRNISAVFPV